MTGPQSAEAVRAGDARACGHGYEHGDRRSVHTAEGWKPVGSPFIQQGLHLGPCPPDAEWTDKQLDQFTAEWERQARRRYVITTVLPRRARIRLACKRHVDKAGIWLVRHGHYRAAVRLWRAFGMWRR